MICGAFEKIYASSFYYNERGVAVWPAQVINYTYKTQFLFRIEKGVLDINDPGVNDYFPPEDLRVPFRNMVYIGDSDTDIPCMKLVNSYGGHSIGVYNPETQDKEKVFKMTRDKRVRYYAPADYTEGSELDELLKAIIDKTAAYEVLEGKHVSALLETRAARRAERARATLEKVQEVQEQVIAPFNELSESLTKTVKEIQKTYSNNIKEAITAVLSPEEYNEKNKEL